VSSKQSQLELDDTIESAIVKLAEGNPGAAVVLSRGLVGEPWHDLMRILWLDERNLRGGALWRAQRPENQP
jgi:hypothetical protein